MIQPLTEGQTVKVSWIDKPGKLIRKGEETSEIKFPDGKTRYIPNEQLKEYKS